MAGNLGTLKGAAVFRHIDSLFDIQTNDVAYRSQMGQTQSFVIVSALRKLEEISQARTSAALSLVVQQFDGLIAIHQPTTTVPVGSDLVDAEDEDVNLLIWLAIIRSTALLLQLFADSLTQFYHTIESNGQFWTYEDHHPLHYILTSIPARLRTLHRLIVHRVLPQYPLFSSPSPMTSLLAHRSTGSLLGGSPTTRRRSPAVVDCVPSRCSEISERPCQARITFGRIIRTVQRAMVKFRQAGRKWFHAFRTPVKFRLFVRQIFGDQVRHNCRLLRELEKQVVEQLGHGHSLLVNMLQTDSSDGLCVAAKQNIIDLRNFLTTSHFTCTTPTTITLIQPERTRKPTNHPFHHPAEEGNSTNTTTTVIANPTINLTRPVGGGGGFSSIFGRGPPAGNSDGSANGPGNGSTTTGITSADLLSVGGAPSTTVSPEQSPLLAPLRLRPSFSDEELDPRIAIKQLIGLIQVVHDYESEVGELIATTRPSRTRWWLHIVTVGYAIYKGVRMAIVAQLNRDKIIRYFRRQAKYYWYSYITEPLQGIYTTLIKDEFHLPHLGPQSWRSEMESLINMVVQYHKDHAFNTAFTDADENRVMKGLSQGDLGTINSDYENCIKTPILAFMFGDMTRLLLIQLQHQKVNITRVYETLDQVMELNELNFHLMALMPAILLVLFFTYAYATRKRISSQPVYKTIRMALWEVDRLLNRSSSSKKLDWCEQGYLLLELFKMRTVARKIQGTELRKCFLEDLTELEDANLTTLQRLHTLQRMYRVYWFLLPVKNRT